MKPFEQLTPRGQAKRLKGVVVNALPAYDFEVTDIRLVGMFTNTIFRLKTTDDQTYIMRICNPFWRTRIDLDSEIMWLQALNRDTHIEVPQPIPTKEGTFVVEATAKGITTPCRCVVMSWIPGVLMGKRLNETNLYKMGILFARLHDHGAQFVPPTGFTQRKMNSIYARDEEDVLFSADYRDAFTPTTLSILHQTADKVSDAFSQLYRDPNGLQVIHNDLHHDNIKIYQGQLCPLDFEDTIWGYPVQDIAMALQDLMTDVAADAYDGFQSAFRSGYESLRAWPENYAGQIDTFRAGRMVWVANYVARYQRQYLREHIDWLAPQFQRYLEIGLIRKV